MSVKILIVVVLEFFLSGEYYPPSLVVVLFHYFSICTVKASYYFVIWKDFLVILSHSCQKIYFTIIPVLWQVLPPLLLLPFYHSVTTTITFTATTMSFTLTNTITNATSTTLLSPQPSLPLLPLVLRFATELLSFAWLVGCQLTISAFYFDNYFFCFCFSFKKCFVQFLDYTISCNFLVALITVLKTSEFKKLRLIWFSIYLIKSPSLL